MRATTSFAVEQLPRLLGRLDIAPPPGLEHPSASAKGVPSKPQATAAATCRVEPHDKSPMFLDPILTEPFFVTNELSPRVPHQPCDLAMRSASDDKPSHGPGLGGASRCSTAIPATENSASWAPVVDEKTVMPTLHLGSPDASPHGGRSSSSLLPDRSHDRAQADGFSAAPFSTGSMMHSPGTCKPCDFARRGGCRAGARCEFCHLCTAEDAKRKKKENKKLYRHLRK
eukprot:TRINITY_DN2716_c0_g4_i1.p1 TRINITY_DN2716_c0_g4~~TRINITY_DN2716_c0_g4_i1.p1  ORF type:complete len:253 (-),score=30.80 TRINITY_DN2716_c0_g4_i1:1128-1811(-)